MHASSIIRFFLAASAVSGLELGAPGSFALARRSVGLMAAVAVPVLALPTVDVEARHHQGKKTKSSKNNKRVEEEQLEARHHQGKKTKSNKNNKRVEKEQLEARHHQGKKTKGGNNNKREEETDLEDRDVEARHHQGKKAKSSKNN